MKTARSLALHVLQRIEEDGAYSHLVLNHELKNSALSELDRRFVTQLVYGTVAWRRSLDILIGRDSKRNVRDIEVPILRVLRMAAYQLVFLRVPDHAAVDEAVEWTKEKHPDAKGYVNGVLRALSKHKTYTWWKESDRERKVARYLGERYSIPTWLANRIHQRLKIDDAEIACAAFNEARTNWIRLRVGEPDEEWTAGSIPGSFSVPGVANLHERLKSRDVVVQDLGAQIAVQACGDVVGKRVLDLCAGLGGKALYLADLGAEVVAVEPHIRRGDMVSHERVEVQATTAQEFKSEQLFDVVLVDAPCTGLGVLARHPEARWTKTEADIQQLAKVQANILAAAAKWVKPGGVLVYVVCTFTREETTRQVEKLPDEFTPLAFDVENGLLKTEKGFAQLWTHSDDTDAFFIAKMRRRDA